MIPPLLPALLLLAATAVAGPHDRKPVNATIVDVPSERRDWGTGIGNIQVRFADGHSEVWTSLGKCMEAHVSPAGLVGWTRFTSRNNYGEPVNDTLRIRFPNGRIADFRHGPFIEQWAFVEGDLAVVIQSRGRHGPAKFIKYNLQLGSVLGCVEVSTPFAQLPGWAQPFADDRPKR